MFTKTDPFKSSGQVKKILIILIILLLVVLAAGFFIYKNLIGNSVVNYSEGSALKTQGEQTQEIQQNSSLQNIVPQNQDSSVSIKAEGQNGGGTLTVCLDKCGDGICQTVDKNCTGDSFSCVCKETKEECPKDCK